MFRVVLGSRNAFVTSRQDTLEKKFHIFRRFFNPATLWAYVALRFALLCICTTIAQDVSKTQVAGAFGGRDCEVTGGNLWSPQSLTCTTCHDVYNVQRVQFRTVFNAIPCIFQWEGLYWGLQWPIAGAAFSLDSFCLMCLLKALKLTSWQELCRFWLLWLWANFFLLGLWGLLSFRKVPPLVWRRTFTKASDYHCKNHCRAG